MLPHRRALIALTVLVLAAGGARAQTASSDKPDLDVGLKLKLQSSLLPPAAPDPDEELPVFLEADRLEGTQNKDVKAEGNAMLRRRGQIVFADVLRYSLENSVVTAVGHVRFDRLGDIITGDYASFNLDDESGYVDNPTYQFRQFHAHGQASKLEVRDRDRYRAIRATYTNCDVGNEDWYLKVQRLDIDRLRDVGEGHNATLYFKDVPVLYTPWIDFPVSSRRKSGFLPPTYGSTATSGFEVTAPYYWNIEPNMDYTVAPRVMSRRGMQLGNEFRYLDPDYKGLLQADYLPEDRVANRSRWAVLFQHDQNLGHGFAGGLNIQRVSDDTYFTDLSDKIAATSQSVLPQEGWLKYEGGWWSLYGRYQHWQTLQDPLAPITPPYARAPQITLVASQQDVLGSDVGFTGEVVNFMHPTLLTGRRQNYYPTVSYPIRTPFFFLTPKAGINYTQYSFPDNVRDAQTRTLPIFSVDSGMTFERDTTLRGRDFVQTLEPELYYLYIPFRDQTQLPVFDSALKDFNFTSIFSENKFSGADRINDANQITAAVGTRLLDPETGIEKVRALIGQRYYLEQPRVTLDSALPTSPVPSNVESNTATRSDLLALFSGALTRTWSLDSGLQYGVNSSEFERFNVALRDQPEPGKVLNLGYRFTRDFLDQIDISTQWPLSRRWAGLARYNYSLSDKALLEALAGLEYNAGCWTLRFVLHRFVTATQERTNTFFFQIELTGLSRLGSSPLELLRQGIGGYTQPSLHPRGAEPYYPGMSDQ
ncbi:MAG TPA: LPS-assembly protein LptD [Burkholderiales bacterium]|nr:LPS-assembly protein LptD [Burkholderiales bacterium]